MTFSWRNIEALLRAEHGITDDTFKGSAKDIWNLFVEAGWKPPSDTIDLAIEDDIADLTRDEPPSMLLSVDAGNMHVRARIPKSTVFQYPELFERMVMHAVEIVRRPPVEADS